MNEASSSVEWLCAWLLLGFCLASAWLSWIFWNGMIRLVTVVSLRCRRNGWMDGWCRRLKRKCLGIGWLDNFLQLTELNISIPWYTFTYGFNSYLDERSCWVVRRDATSDTENRHHSCFHDPMFPSFCGFKHERKRLSSTIPNQDREKKGFVRKENISLGISKIHNIPRWIKSNSGGCPAVVPCLMPPTRLEDCLGGRSK